MNFWCGKIVTVNVWDMQGIQEIMYVQFREHEDRRIYVFTRGVIMLPSTLVWKTRVKYQKDQECNFEWWPGCVQRRWWCQCEDVSRVVLEKLEYTYYYYSTSLVCKFTETERNALMIMPQLFHLHCQTRTKKQPKP